jgi:hypothetical protein
MVEITNVKVYELMESVVASRNAMRLTPPEYTAEEVLASFKRAITLAHARSGSGHDNWLKGVRVSFDIKYPGYFSPELQRYNFIDIVTSASKMHRLIQMNMDVCFNEYVTQEAKDMMKRYIAEYNLVCETGDKEDIYHAFMKVISNCPYGIELFMRCSTNYLQLKTIYSQRKHHKLKEDWGAFCDMIKGLPYANDLITFEKQDDNT